MLTGNSLVFYVKKQSYTINSLIKLMKEIIKFTEKNKILKDLPGRKQGKRDAIQLVSVNLDCTELYDRNQSIKVMNEFLMQKLLPYFQINFCLLPVQYKILLGLISFIKKTFYCLNKFIVVLLPHSYNRGFTQR